MNLLITNSNPFILFIFASYTVNFGAEYPYFYQFIFLWKISYEALLGAVLPSIFLSYLQSYQNFHFVRLSADFISFLIQLLCFKLHFFLHFFHPLVHLFAPQLQVVERKNLGSNESLNLKRLLEHWESFL